MNTLFRELGEKLVEDSQQSEEFSARGAVEDLFPYIYSASRRMSARAISRWLTGNGVKISDVTIAKALREPEKYAEVYASEYEPAARVFGDAHELGITDVLGNRDHFEMAKHRPAMLNVNCDEEARDALEEVKKAEHALEEWFKLTEEFRRLCISCVSDGEGEEDGQSD